MSSRNTVKLKQVWDMLDVCCGKGQWSAEDGKKREYWRVYHQGRCYPYLPTGAHGRRDNPEVKVGHVKHMVQDLGIDQWCAEQCIPGLFPKAQPPSSEASE